MKDKRGCLGKFTIVILTVAIIFAIVPMSVSYAGIAKIAENVGGTLLKPIVDLILMIGDVIIDFMHSVFFNAESSLIYINLDNTILEWVISIAIAVIITVIVFNMLTAAALLPAVLLSVKTLTAGSLAMSIVGAAVTTFPTALKVGLLAFTYTSSLAFPHNISLPIYLISPEEIFIGDIPFLEVDFFSDDTEKIKQWTPTTGIMGEAGQPIEVRSIANTLKPTIASWYYTLRTIAIVAMIPILMYVGIRIMTASVASDKAKYKSMLTDWVVAFCLIFAMHYIMIFANEINNSIVNILKSFGSDNIYRTVIKDEHEGKIRKRLEEYGLAEKLGGDVTIDSFFDEENGKTYLVWPTNYMGMLRVKASEEADSDFEYIGYVIAFLVLVAYTVFFLWTYLRRLVYMAFLTIIAPLVAMTYPIDKINDGKAQAFDNWLKEYLFNLLIQPMHLILYVVLIRSAFEISSTNVVYSLVAIGFMVPAEKLIRRFFGFEKAQTPGALGGAAGAGLVMAGLNKIFRKPHQHDNKSNENNKDETEEEINYQSNSDSNMNSMFDEPDTGKEEKSNSEEEASEDKEKEKDEKEEEKEERQEKKEEKSAAQKMREQEEESTKEAMRENRRKTEEELKKAREERIRRMQRQITPKGIKGASKEYLRRRLKNYKPGKFAKNLARKGSGILMGAGVGMIGAAAGIATGDMSKVLQYGSTAAYGGYAFGSSLIKDKKDQTKLIKDLKDAYDKSRFDNIDDYKLAKLLERRDNFINNIDNLEKLQELLGEKDISSVKKKLEEDYSEFVDQGFNIDEIAASIKLVEEKGWSKDTATSAAKCYKEVGKKTSKMGQKEYEDLKSRYKRNLSNEYPNYTDAQLENIVGQIFIKMDTFGKTKDDLTKI